MFFLSSALVQLPDPRQTKAETKPSSSVNREIPTPSRQHLTCTVVISYPRYVVASRVLLSCSILRIAAASLACLLVANNYNRTWTVCCALEYTTTEPSRPPGLLTTTHTRLQNGVEENHQGIDRSGPVRLHSVHRHHRLYGGVGPAGFFLQDYQQHHKDLEME